MGRIKAAGGGILGRFPKEGESTWFGQVRITEAHRQLLCSDYDPVLMDFKVEP
ncbi:hypothetical protein P7K49_029118, partial [Saguinus oedipus]